MGLYMYIIDILLKKNIYGNNPIYIWKEGERDRTLNMEGAVFWKNIFYFGKKYITDLSF